MNYETVADFLAEWSKPDGMNILVSYTYGAEDAVKGCWFLTIAQPRKMQFMEITIGPVLGHETAEIEAWAAQSVKALETSLLQDRQFALDEYKGNRK